MGPAAAVTFLQVVLAVHIAAVVIAFGVTFAYPIIFALARRLDPHSLPVLHRIEIAIERRLVNPGLLVVVLAGIYLASKGHQWGAFFVLWGIAVSVIIGGVIGALMIPMGKRAAALAERDLAVIAAELPGRGRPEVSLSREYTALVRRMALIGSLLSLLVLITIFFMATRLGG